MAAKSQISKGRDDALSLNNAINVLDLAKKAMGVVPAKAALSSASDLLALIRDSLANKADYVEIGLICAHVCETFHQGAERRPADQFSKTILKAIEQLTTTVNEIHKNIIKRGKRNRISRRFHAKDDKEALASWKLVLNGILRVFNAELGPDTHVTVSNTRRDIPNADTTYHNATARPIVSKARNDVASASRVFVSTNCNTLKSSEGTGTQNRATHASAPGEFPPLLSRNSSGPAPGIPHDCGRTRAIVSEVHRDLTNAHTMIFDIHRNILKSQEGTGGQPQLSQNSVLGESPPPPPRVFFGRDELIEQIVGLTEQLTPVALIGAGGIGKTSIALAVLHDDRIERRFGEDRRFIRCDEFPASRTHFLRRLSKVIGAGIENPKDLTPLRPFFSSRRMLIVLDNAESILDPQGTSAQEMYAVVDELARFNNICLFITCRISTIPPGCEALEIPTLTIDAAYNTFHRIYKHDEHSDLINNILEELDFHPLSITLLATVAQQNKWDVNRLTREWERQRTGVLRAQHSGSLAATIELSLASPMFRDLGPDARGLLGVVAFFPQGIDENNVDWLFPTIPDGPNMLDKFCILSLTYRANGFIMMLAPLRDYLRPKDPKSSLLLGATKEHYFARLSAVIYPDCPGFEESRWIMSEDVNVEHMLDVFTSVDKDSEIVWSACASFMNHLYWHKPRLIMLGPKIEALPDDHPSKATCLNDLSGLFYMVGNWAEQKRLLAHALKLGRDGGDDYQVARILSALSKANRQINLHEEGIGQAKEASEIFGRLGCTGKQADSLIELARALANDDQFDAAEEAASRAIDLLPEKGEQHHVCRGHRVLGVIYDSKGETEKAIGHFEVALGIASSFSWDHELFWIHFFLAQLFSGRGRFGDALTYLEHAKPHAVDDIYLLARASQLQAEIWNKQHRPEEAKSEALRALDVFEKLGAENDAEGTRTLLQWIDAQGTGLPSDGITDGSESTPSSSGPR